MADEGQSPFRMTPVPEDEGAPVEMRVAGPASGLVVVAALAVLTNCVGSVAIPRLLRGDRVSEPPPWMSPDEARMYERGQAAAPFLLGCAVGSATLAIYAVVFVGGLRMRALKSYGWATTGAWVALLPLSPAVLVGLPVGIWALRVLGNPEVRTAFHRHIT